MRQLIKHFSWMAMLALGLQSARAYSLAGPIGNGGDAWQVLAIGYGRVGDLVAPKNLGEEYRRDIPVLYYSYDQNFLDYFGSNGTVSVDAAFAIMNNLTNVDSYSSLLSEFPVETRQQNYEAGALGLFDMKSFTLGEIAEQMGLADPVRYAWTLHDRFLPAGTTCPSGEEYLVVQRNYDFTSSPLDQLQYSPYVNDTLYTYYIEEYCTAANSPFLANVAWAQPQAVDPLADTYSAVASFDIGYGDFYTGLTRDDVAGLRYLLSTNNLNFEAAPAGSLLLTTNIGTPAQETTLTNVNLGPLLAAATTNSPAVLAGLFPGLVVAGSTFSFGVIYNPNVVTYFTNYVGEPYGSPQISVTVTNGYIAVPLTIYANVFGNVVTNGNLAGNPGVINSAGISLTYSPNTAATVVTTSLSPLIGSPYPAPVVTNTTVQSVTQVGTPSGEYFLIPAGQCGWEIVSPQPPGYPIAGQTVYTTNVISTATATNGFVASQSIVTSFTPHTFVVEPIDCASATPAAGLYQGVGNVKFVRADFDSLLGQFFQPVTNNFSMVLVTNSQPVTQFFQRVVTAPDFTFSAADLATGPAAAPVVLSYSRNETFDQTQILPGLAGPGVIDSPTTITFDKVGPVYFNDASISGLSGASYFTGFAPLTTVASEFYDFYFVWAQFNGSTNEPAVFPSGTSIANLENEALIRISPGSPLPDGTNGVPYSFVYTNSSGTVYTNTFTATGGAFMQPFTWSASGLPPNLVLATDANGNGKLSGTPAQSGTFDFTVQLTDALSRSVQWNYSITIH